MLDVNVYADGNPFMVANVYAGLCDLAQQGAIRLTLSYPWSRLNRRPCHGDATLWLTVRDERGQRARHVCFDLHDKSDKFIKGRLADCDVYFKRSYHQPDVDSLGSSLARKVVPFGLNYACRSAFDRAALWRGLGYYVSNYSRFLTEPWHSTRAFYSMFLYGMKLYYASPLVRDFEGTPLGDMDPVILFQTRVWGPRGAGTWAEIDERRVSIIRALKAAFGGRFIGGLIPSEVAREKYSDCISTRPKDPTSYIGMNRRTLIGIYTMGLHHSDAFKLAEYLAAAKCVVAEPPRNQLPVPLQPGRHYLPFETPEECVTACQRLLGDPGLSNRMRQSNHEYYQENVRPAVHVLKCLRAAVAA